MADLTNYRVLHPRSDISWFFGEEHGWPTVVAIRGREMIGALSTHKDDSALIAGPMKVNTNMPFIVGLKMVDAYDEYLHSLGVKEYIFNVDTENDRWASAVEAMASLAGVERCGRKQRVQKGKNHKSLRHLWYKRILDSRGILSMKYGRLTKKKLVRSNNNG